MTWIQSEVDSLQKDWPDLGYSALAKPDSHIVDFEVYEIEGTTQDGQLLWHKNGSPSWPDPVEDIAEAQMFVRGTVKWDGCSDWEIYPDACFHGCSRSDLTDLGEVLARCWDWTEEVCEKWSSEVASV